MTPTDPTAASPKLRLGVHLVWAEDEPGQNALMDDMYVSLARDPRQPLTRGLGIPIWTWRSRSPEVLDRIPLQLAQRTAVVLLVSSPMVLDWGDALVKFRARFDGTQHRLFPASWSQAAVNIPIADLNFISLHNLASPHERSTHLRDSVAHELCRLLLALPRTGDTRLDTSAPPIRLFISYARADGRAMGESLRTHVREKSTLATFFDANDIAPGHRFADEIAAGVSNSALVAIQTDAYASRGWCRKEILIAKRHGRPVVVVNAVREGEPRSFPYLGNVRTMRWDTAGADDAARCRSVVGATLRECLRVLHFEQALRLRGVAHPEDHVTAYPPELCTVAMRGQQPAGGRVIYADPPLGDEEVALMSEIGGKVTLATPISLARRDLSGKVVAISASESPDMAERGWAESQLSDFLVELSRYVLASGGAVGYGGDLRKGGLTEPLIDLARAHDGAGIQARVQLFLYWPYHLEKLSADDEAKMHPEVRVHRGSRPAAIAEGTPLDAVHKDPAAAQACLTAMRQGMTSRIHARVFLGGRLAGFSGLLPGVLEEAALAIGAGQPVYLVGAFGGVTAELINELGPSPRPRRLGDPASAPLLDQVRAAGVAGLRNGLSPEENQELFTTQDLLRAIELVVLGLGKTMK